MSEHPPYEYRATPEYYAERAREEHRRAEIATDPRAAAVHGELAARYQALASGSSLEPPGAELPAQQPPAQEPPMLRSVTG